MISFPDLTGRGKNNFSLVVSASISDSDVHGVKTRAEPVIQLHDDLDLTHRFLEIVSFFLFHSMRAKHRGSPLIYYRSCRMFKDLQQTNQSSRGRNMIL